MKLETALAMRDVAVELKVTDALMQNLVPEERLAELKVEVHKAVVEARQDWENSIFDEIYGPERGAKLRSLLRELNIE